MRPTTLHALELIVATATQTLILALAWGFLSAVLVENPLVVTDSLAMLMRSRTTELTWVVTLTATALSIVTGVCFSITLKEALRHRMHDPISLVHLSGGIALARGAFLLNFRHPIPTLITLVIFGLTKLLVSSWATLLTPGFVAWNAAASGWELDITSNYLETTLQTELLQSGAALVRDNSSAIIDVGGVMSGIAAAAYSFGTPGIFDFNGVKYNISTGGILPAAPSYNGSSDQVAANNTGLAFAGGLVPTHLNITSPKDQTHQGLFSTYTLLQQGLTANVTCQQTNGSAGLLNFTSSFNPISVPLADGNTDYWLWTWNITSDCSQGIPSKQQYVTKSNSSSTQDPATGFIASLVCPYPLAQTGFAWNHITVATNASWKYQFLPLTVCTIDPLVTTSRVTYVGGVVNSTVIHSQPLGPSNTNLTQFLAAIIDYQARTTQGLTTNSIGDALFSIYVSASSSKGTTAKGVTNLLLRELEQYWRGVIEFSGTFLKSGFSVYPQAIPENARIPVLGNETITTMGWYQRSATYGYTIIPITLVAFLTYAAVAYTLWHIYIERGHESFTTFDPSNPIHVMMVSSTRDRGNTTETTDKRSDKRDTRDTEEMVDKGDTRGTKDDLEDCLSGFERGGIAKNENLRVQLTTVSSNRKRFKVETQSSPFTPVA